MKHFNIRYLIKKKEETCSTINQPQSGHPRKLDTRQRRTIVKESFLNSRELAVDVASKSGTIVIPQIIRNILFNVNIRRGVPRKNHLLVK